MTSSISYTIRFTRLEDHHRVADDGGEIEETVDRLGAGGRHLTARRAVDGGIGSGRRSLLPYNSSETFIHIFHRHIAQNIIKKRHQEGRHCPP